MKKILVALMSFMLLFGSVSYANGLAKQDAELLFGTQKIVKVQAVTLDKSEMAKTEGEGWIGGWIAAAGYGSWYLGDYLATGRWHGSWSGFATVVGIGSALFPW